MGTTETILSIVLIILLIALLVVIALLLKNSLTEKLKSGNQEKNKGNNEIQPQKQVNNKKSVLSFLDFEKIEDNMIITKNGQKYIMIIECQGINYDLMSELEKNGVEYGFLQFLNTLRYPIQIYLQTRTINLSKSLNGYRDRLKKHESDYREAERNYIHIANDVTASDKDIINAKIEYDRKRNVYEYSKDIIQNTERMSQNKNVLTRRYYVVLSQFVAENKNEKEDFGEKIEEVFQELYTKSQSLIRALSSCSVQAKILNSEELVELMYIAYNRDEYDTYGMDKAIQAGYDELYSTGEDAVEKRIKLIDKLIEKRATDKINSLVEIAKTERERRLQEKEKNLDDYINIMAKKILNENKNFLGEDISDIVEEKLEEEKRDRQERKEKLRRRKEGAKNAVKKESKRRRSE